MHSSRVNGSERLWKSISSPGKIDLKFRSSGKLKFLPFRLAAKLSVCPIPREEKFPFPSKNLIEFQTYWDQIEMDKRWRNNVYRIQYRQLPGNARIQLEKDFLFISNWGEVRRHRRTVENWYSDDFKSIGRENSPQIASFATRNNSTLISGSLEGTCSIFVDMETETATAAVNKQLINAKKEAIRFVDCDGKDYFITATSFETKEWRLDSEWGLYELTLLRESQTGYVTCLRISPDGTQFFRSHANLLTIVDRETGIVHPLECESEMALDVIWPPSPVSLITAHRDGSLRLFDLRTFSDTRIMSNMSNWNVSLALISPWTVVCGYRSNSVKVYDIRVPSRVVTSFQAFEDEKQATLKQIAADTHHLHIATDNKLISLDFNCL